jgi:hypothetical protein
MDFISYKTFFPPELGKLTHLNTYQFQLGKMEYFLTSAEINYYDLQSKQESMEWRYKGEAPVRKTKVSKSTQKIMTTIFWDCENILLIDFKERNTTVNGRYYDSLLHRLRQEIKAKRRGKLARGVLLLQDNAPVHTVAIAKGAISQKLTINLIVPIWLYVTIFYFQLSKKKRLRGRKFKTDDEFQSAVLEHF